MDQKCITCFYQDLVESEHKSTGGSLAISRSFVLIFTFDHFFRLIHAYLARVVDYGPTYIELYDLLSHVFH